MTKTTEHTNKKQTSIHGGRPIPPPEDSRRESHVAFVGGGRDCVHLLKCLHEGRLPLPIKVLGIADTDDSAPGMVLARELGIQTTTRHVDLFSLEGLDIIIDLTGSSEVAESLMHGKPSEVSFLDRKAAEALLFPLIAEEGELEVFPAPKNGRKRQHTQTILDSLPYRIMVVNNDMTINMVNQTFLRNMGLSYEDVLGKHCYEVRYGLNRPCGECDKPCYLEEVKKQRRTISTIHDICGEGGEERFEVITVSPILDDQGEIVNILEASRDVTERIKLEREVQKSQVFLQNVIQSAADGIVVVDTKGRVLLFNEGMERLTGYTAEEIMEWGHLSKFYNMDLAKENMNLMRSDQHGPVGKLNPVSMSITGRGGEEIPVTLSASIIKINGAEVGSVGVFTDMREILRMRKDLEEAHLKLVESEKIASVGRMAAGVAHEINNPLSGILIYAELVKDNIKGNDEVFGDIQEIIDQTLRCKKIVSDLLEFSRQSIGKASSFSLEKLISKCLNLLINQASFQNIDVRLDIDRDLPEMVGDMGQLQQVFTNLFINAADAMEGKGRLEIKARYDSERSRFLISLADTGPGIPTEYRDKVFDIFFTTKPVGKGTGLGLSISQNIIKLHGGSIEFECPPEGGTTFNIELPLEFVESPEEQPVFIGLDGA
jgi:two-component system NtrC family sensor kinase